MGRGYAYFCLCPRWWVGELDVLQMWVFVLVGGEGADSHWLPGDCRVSMLVWTATQCAHRVCTGVVWSVLLVLKVQWMAVKIQHIPQVIYSPIKYVPQMKYIHIWSIVGNEPCMRRELNRFRYENSRWSPVHFFIKGLQLYSGLIPSTFSTNLESSLFTSIACMLNSYTWNLGFKSFTISRFSVVFSSPAACLSSIDVVDRMQRKPYHLHNRTTLALLKNNHQWFCLSNTTYSLELKWGFKILILLCFTSTSTIPNEVHPLPTNL